MQIAQVLSGYTLGGADLLRRAMGKKIRAEMEAQRNTFIDGAVARGVERARAASIFDQVDKFAGYGFNKSHAAAYAMVAYQTAYLKANHPVAFLAACMSQDIGNTDKLKTFHAEAERLAVRLLPPDINRSAALFAVEAGPDRVPAIRYALAAVRNVGLQAMEALVAERAANGPFADLADFARRSDARTLNKRQLENLARAGAFDSLDSNRARVFDSIETVLRHAAAAAAERASNQVSLFAGEEAQGPPLVLPERRDWPAMERLKNELEALGFYLSAHPLDQYTRALDRVGAVRAADLAGRLAAGGVTRLKLGGVMQSRKERTSQRGSRFAFVELSDLSSTYEVTVFSELLAASRELLDSGEPLLITADARLEEGGVRLVAQAIERLDAAAAHAAAGLKIVVDGSAALADLAGLIRSAGRGRGRIALLSRLDAEREVEVALAGGYSVSPKLAAAMQLVPGVIEVREI